jgi:hypothetical protein
MSRISRAMLLRRVDARLHERQQGIDVELQADLLLQPRDRGAVLAVAGERPARPVQDPAPSASSPSASRFST